MVSGFYSYKILQPNFMNNGVEEFNQYIMDIMMPQAVMAKDIIEGDIEVE